MSHSVDKNLGSATPKNKLMRTKSIASESLCIFNLKRSPVQKYGPQESIPSVYVAWQARTTAPSYSVPSPHGP
jgi:hypothetical protein